MSVLIVWGSRSAAAVVVENLLDAGVGGDFADEDLGILVVGGVDVDAEIRAGRDEALQPRVDGVHHAAAGAQIDGAEAEQIDPRGEFLRVVEILVAGRGVDVGAVVQVALRGLRGGGVVCGLLLHEFGDFGHRHALVVGDGGFVLAVVRLDDLDLIDRRAHRLVLLSAGEGQKRRNEEYGCHGSKF